MYNFNNYCLKTVAQKQVIQYNHNKKSFSFTAKDSRNLVPTPQCNSSSILFSRPLCTSSTVYQIIFKTSLILHMLNKKKRFDCEESILSQSEN